MGTPPAAARKSRGWVHTWVSDAGHDLTGRIETRVVPLERLEAFGPGRNRLEGRFVRVRNASIVNEPGARAGEFVPVAIGDARADENGDFLFHPRRGGARIDKLTLRSEKYRQRYVEASRFGEVNTYFHLDRIAAHVDALLRELGAPPLPRVVAVVNAHHAATKRADGTRDGMLRADRWVPFQGGHYRLPARRYGVAEYDPISPEGEIHLGPGWKLLEHGALVEAAGTRYRHIASHNAGTLYHEYGHHIARHTADFRANALRPPRRQSNRKTDLDEGFSDYWAATMLATPHIWAWHRRHDSRELHGRSLVAPVTMVDYDGCEEADAHANGTILAGALWDLRERMEADPGLGTRACDRLVLLALLLLGSEVGPERPPRVKTVRGARAGFATALDALLRAEGRLHGGGVRAWILECFASRGIAPGEGGGRIPPSRSRDDAEALLSPDGSGRVWRMSEEDRRARAEKKLAAARVRLARHVAAEDIPETGDLFARGELGRHLRALDEPPLSVVVVGDTMIGARTTPLIARHGPGYVFKFVRPLLRRAALVLGNLEGPLTRGARRLPRNFSYRVDASLALALRRAGFRIMTLANNHLLDCGRQGVVETLEALRHVGIAPIGAGEDEAQAHAPVIREVGGLKIGFLGYYWNRRTAARDGLPGSAMDPPEALAKDIGALRARADRIVVTFHWGLPYVREPTPEDRAKARFAIDCGADAVIGHHAHVLLPFEIHRERPIFYGVGNFAFGSGNSKAEGLLLGLLFGPERTRVLVYPLYVKNRDPRVNYQPRVLRGAAARRVLAHLCALSEAHAASMVLQNFRGMLELPWTRLASVRPQESRSLL